MSGRRTRRRTGTPGRAWLLILAVVDAVLCVRAYHDGGWPLVTFGILLVLVALTLDWRRPRRRTQRRR